MQMAHPVPRAAIPYLQPLHRLEAVAAVTMPRMAVVVAAAVVVVVARQQQQVVRVHRYKAVMAQPVLLARAATARAVVEVGQSRLELRQQAPIIQMEEMEFPHPLVAQALPVVAEEAEVLIPAAMPVRLVRAEVEEVAAQMQPAEMQLPDQLIREEEVVVVDLRQRAVLVMEHPAGPAL